MEKYSENPTTGPSEAALRARLRRGAENEPERPLVFRRKIDCDGRSSTANHHPTVRGARSPARDPRSIY